MKTAKKSMKKPKTRSQVMRDYEKAELMSATDYAKWLHLLTPKERANELAKMDALRSTLLSAMEHDAEREYDEREKREDPEMASLRAQLLRAITNVFGMGPVGRIEIRHVVGKTESRAYALYGDQISGHGVTMRLIAGHISVLVRDDARNFQGKARYALHFFDQDDDFIQRTILDVGS